MLLNSVIIVLREVLEAALMISVLLAMTRLLSIRSGWLATALMIGIVGAAVYGYQIGRISDLFGGVGQEVVNASLQIAIFCALLVCLFLVSRSFRQSFGPSRLLPVSMAAAVSLAVVREGSEILIYVAGFMGAQNFFVNVGIGSIIGACIGLSAGVLLYYLLLMQPVGRSRLAIQILLGLIGAGMSAQASRLLIQADWISVNGAFWDTSSVLSEDSIAGQLLYALIGYEASPSAIEVIIYSSCLLLMGAAFLFGRYASPDHSKSST
jgi:high-affinity iron transporter